MTVPAWHPPVGVDGGERLLASSVAGLRLLQEDAADDAPRVQAHELPQRLDEGHVGAQPHQHLRGSGHLLRGLAVARHGHDGPAGTGGGCLESCGQMSPPRQCPQPTLAVSHIPGMVPTW